MNCLHQASISLTQKSNCTQYPELTSRVQAGILPANHRASGCALEARRMVIAVTDELQESVGSDSNRALRAMCGRQVFFLQTIARADVPWSAVWRGSARSMDTNRCHRASRCALESCRMAIAVTDELQESVGQGTNQALRAVCGRSGFFLQIIARAGVALTESSSDDYVWQQTG